MSSFDSFAHNCGLNDLAARPLTPELFFLSLKIALSPITAAITHHIIIVEDKTGSSRHYGQDLQVVRLH